MGLPRILFYAVGRAVTVLIAGFGLGFDCTGGSWLTISSGNWGLIGLIALMVFVFITVGREIDLALQQEPQIEVYPNESIGGKITLVVRNRSQVSAIFSAVMSCKLLRMGRAHSHIQRLKNASMC
jgi:hypothetical protein